MSTYHSSNLGSNQSSSRRTARRSNFAESYSSLEPRLALTTFIVNTLSDAVVDDANISLREAIIAANTNEAIGNAPAGEANGDIIRFDSSLTDGTITLAEGQFTITDDLMIQGGGFNVTIDGGGSSRLFDVTTEETVAFGGLNFTGGNADTGAAINSTGSGRLIVVNGDFQENEATGLGGGAIFQDGGSLFVTSSTFVGNEATGESGSGGAVLQASGSAAFTASTFSSNVANRAGGAIEIIDGSLFLNDATLGGATRDLANIAGPSGSAAPGNGGGLHVTGEALVVLTDSLVSNNTAASEGGGLWNQTGSDLRLTGSTVVSNNEAFGADADNGGGGIFNNGGNVFINGASITQNVASGAAGSGGGILSTDGVVVVVNSDINDNAAARAGGGIEIIDGNLSVFQSDFERNDAGVSVTAAPGNGGGIHITGSARTTLAKSRFSQNIAASEGGAVWNQTNSDMFITDSTLIGNIAEGDSADNGGGGIFNNGGNVFVSRSVVIGNEANGASGSGGGALSVAGVLRFDDSTISGNTASRAGGGVELIDGQGRFNRSTLSGNDTGVNTTAAPGNGGGLHVTGEDTVVRFSASTVTNNSAANEGGGLWNQTGSQMLIDANTRIQSNRSSGVGGGVYNRGFVRALDALFENNTAATEGGGLFNTGTSSAQVDGSEFVGNSSTGNGGAIFNDGFLSIVDSLFAENSSGGVSSPVFTSDEATTNFNGGNTITGNTPNNGTTTIVLDEEDLIFNGGGLLSDDA